MHPKNLIFDIDGTLWDSRALVAEGYNLQLKSEGLEHLCVTAEDLRPLFGKVMTEIADLLFTELPIPQRYALLERCMASENRHLHNNPCHIGYPQVRQTLEALAKDYRLYIVSNSQRGYPELAIFKLGLDACIRAHLCFGDTGTSKGQTIRRLMQEQDISSAVYIGDTQGDRDAAQEAGIPFVWASYGFGIPDGYDYKIEKIQELLHISW